MKFRCKFPGCTSFDTKQVRLKLHLPQYVAETAPKFHELTLTDERRCKAHQTSFAESFLTDKRWAKILAHVAEDWRARGIHKDAREIQRSTVEVEYFGGEEPSRLIAVDAVRSDGVLEAVGKIPVKG